MYEAVLQDGGVSFSKSYSGKLLREKTFADLVVLWLFLKVFSTENLGTWCPLVQQKRAIRKSFLRENRIFHQFTKDFSLESFLPYSTMCMVLMMLVNISLVYQLITVTPCASIINVFL